MICTKKLNVVIVYYCLCENKWFNPQAIWSKDMRISRNSFRKLDKFCLETLKKKYRRICAPYKLEQLTGIICSWCFYLSVFFYRPEVHVDRTFQWIQISCVKKRFDVTIIYFDFDYEINDEKIHTVKQR